MNRIPLAERMRPQTLDEVVGQDEIIGKGKILTEIAEKKEPTNLIFWGPPGTGKTTLARILAKAYEADFIEISAVTSGKKDVEQVVDRAKQNWNLKIRTVLFVDEIHRFNKAQQDAFLPHVESGLIILIGATTENPSFEVISPLLSRSRVVVLKSLSKDAIKTVLKRALRSEDYKLIKKSSKKSPRTITEDAIDYLADLSYGDARSALGDLELAISLEQHITVDTIKTAAGKKLPVYDKKGDNHYDNISAFIKSMRASDVDATLYYLARMLLAGEDPKFIARRMVIFASEDIGLATNGALNLAVSCFQAVERIGMPECQINLSHVATVLAKCKKSRQSYDAYMRAKKAAKSSMNSPVPLHIRNAPTKLMEDLGYGKGYKWQAGFNDGQNYLPDDIKDEKFFI
jgi:putative ATPase